MTIVQGYDFVHRIVHELSRPDGRTLELGCGTAPYRRSVRGSYIGSDVTAAQYHEGQPRRVDVICSGSDLPFRSGTFDLIFSVGAFDFFPDLARAAREARRVSRPGGHVLVVTYNQRTLRRIHQMDRRRTAARDSKLDPFQLHAYDFRQLRDLFVAQGFRVRFLRGDSPRTPWKAALVRIRPIDMLRRVWGRWLVMDASLE